MLKKVKNSLSRGVRNVIPLRPVANTKPDQTSMASSEGRPVRRQVSLTQTPIREKVLLGVKTPSSNTLKTPKNTSPEPRWCSPVSKSLKNGPTSSLTLKHRLSRTFSLNSQSFLGNSQYKS